MLKTLAHKFTFYYWVIFIAVVTPFYIFGTHYVKDILHATEHEKMELVVKTLTPTIALVISLEQSGDIDNIMQTIFAQTNIESVALSTSNFHKKLQKERKKSSISNIYKRAIIDPFTNEEIGAITIIHSHEYIENLHKKIISVFLGIFIFALVVFSLFYFSVKKELGALKKIAQLFSNYSNNQKIDSIQTQSKTTEIQTIAKSANEMMQNISSYLHRLESFNTELELQVAQKLEKLRAQEKMMIHQSRQAAMGEMLESIAHQWRQPLNIIGLSCVNLEMEHDLGILSDANFKERINTITKNISYMSETIDDFRDFLNPNSEPTLFNPRKTIEAVVEILTAQLKNNKIELVVDEQTPLEFYGIENEFKQVLFVLINNSKDAIKSLQKNFDNFSGKIEIKLLESEGQNLLTFCDNGGGIKEDIIDSIFEPYFTTKFASSGTGIGLYMAKNIIENRMKGSLSAKNEKNGCCFTIKQRIEK